MYALRKFIKKKMYALRFFFIIFPYLELVLTALPAFRSVFLQKKKKKKKKSMLSTASFYCFQKIKSVAQPIFNVNFYFILLLFYFCFSCRKLPNSFMWLTLLFCDSK